MNEKWNLPLDEMELTKNQYRLLDRSIGRLRSCLEMYDKNPELGRKYLLKWYLAGNIRSLNQLSKTKHLNVPFGTPKTDNTHHKAWIAGRDSSNNKIKHQIKFLTDRLVDLLVKVKDQKQ